MSNSGKFDKNDNIVSQKDIQVQLATSVQKLTVQPFHTEVKNLQMVCRTEKYLQYIKR